MSIQEKIKSQEGFITQEDIKGILAEDRLHQVLVRCGSGRFTCAAQDAEHYIEMVGASEHDYVRDVSLIAGDPWMNAEPVNG